MAGESENSRLVTITSLCKLANLGLKTSEKEDSACRSSSINLVILKVRTDQGGGSGSI